MRKSYPTAWTAAVAATTLTISSVLALLGTITGHLIPTIDATYNVGSSGARWKDLSISGTGTSDLAFVVNATNTNALAIRDGNGLELLNANTVNDIVTISGTLRAPTSDLFNIQNDNNSAKYFAVSATATRLQGVSNVTTLLIGKSTDNGNSITLMGDNAYISSQSGKALVLSAPGTNIIYFSVGGANRLIADSSGNVVVGGHTAATARFTVSQNSATTNLFEINNANTNGVYTTKYFTVSSTSTKVSNAFHLEVLETTNTSLTVAATNTVIIMRGVVARTVTLPACAAGDVGRKLYIDDGAQNANTNNITVNRAGSDTIDGGTSKTINTAGGSLQLVCAAATRWFSL